MRTFVYQFEASGDEYTKETYKELYGDDAGFFPEWPTHICVSEDVGEMARDAIVQCLEMKMQFFTNNKVKDIESLSDADKRYLKHFDDKIALYQSIANSLRCLGEKKP